MGARTQLMSCVRLQKSVFIDSSLAWEFGQRRAAGSLRRTRREVAFGFLQGDERAESTGNRAWLASLLPACCPGPGESRQLPCWSYPNPNSKGVMEENAKCTLLGTQSCLEETFVASMC